MVIIMKKIGYILSFCASIIYCCQAQKNTQESVEFIKQFYFEYLTKTDTDKYDKEDIQNNYQKIMNLYCSKRLVNKIKHMQETYELSYDPFIKAQDYHISILDFILVEKNPKKNNNYFVSYRYKNQSEDKRVYIEIEITKINKNFKIIRVDNIN